LRIADRIALLLILFLLCLPMRAFSDQLIVPGKRIGPVRLGITMDKVNQILGNSDMQPKRTREGLMEYRFIKTHLLIVDIDPKTKRVKMVTTGRTPRYRTSSGIRIGSPIKQVQNKMGKKNAVKINNDSYILKYPRKGIEFIFRVQGKDKRLFLITITKKK